MNSAVRKIFIVDDNVTNLTAGKDLLAPFYDVYPAKSADMLFKMLEKVNPDVILLDIEMPEMDGYETIRKLKEDSRFSHIPVIFLTVKNDEGSELLGFDLGAVDYVSKPFSPPLLRKRIENQLLILRQKETIQNHVNNLTGLVHEKTREVFGLQNAVLQTVADLVEFRDGFTGGHITRTQLYMEELLKEISREKLYIDTTKNWNMDFMLPSAQLHDVGKISISDAILNKPGKLTPEEFEIMKTHVPAGVEAIKRIMTNSPDHAFLRHALNFVWTHHEKWDGTGYPTGIKAEDIPLEGRLMAIVDVYDALTSWRPYKNAFSHAEAVKIIIDGKGNHFEPALVDVFVNIESEFNRITQKTKNSR